MCTYLHGPTQGGTYYFRMGIPGALRPIFGKREFYFSLKTKDRTEAKRRVLQVEAPRHAKLLEQAQAELIRQQETGSPPASPPASHRPTEAQAKLEEARWAHEQDAAQIEADEITAQEARRDARQHLGDLFEERMKLTTQELAPWEAAIKDLFKAKDFDLGLAGDKITYLSFRLQEAKAGRNPHAALAAPEAPNASAFDQEQISGKDMMLDTTILDRWAAERGVVAKGKDTHKAVATWFYERVGRKSVELITRQDVLAFKDKLLEQGQSVANTNMKLSRLRTLLGWAYQNDLAPANVADGISVKVADSGKGKRLPFSLADLQAIFSSPVYANGERPTQGRGAAAYWLPLLALFTGARLEEIGQLRVADVQRHEYPDQDGKMLAGWFLHITENTDERGQANRIKNAASERLVPVHPEIERLGFITYVQKLSDQGGRVFPDLKANIYGRLTAKWGEWFGRYMRTVCGVADKRKVFHSFRHTFKDYTRRANITESIQRQLMGHSGKDVADDYGSGYDLHAMSMAMASYKVPGLTIRPI